MRERGVVLLDGEMRYGHDRVLIALARHSPPFFFLFVYLSLFAYLSPCLSLFQSE